MEAAARIAQTVGVISSQRSRMLALAQGALFLIALACLAARWFAPQASPEKMPDFRSLETQRRKADFLDFLAPIVASVNARIAEDKAKLQAVASEVRAGHALSWVDRRWLTKLARAYEVSVGEEGHMTDEALRVLSRRVDVVPASLVLVQAAKESGWGTSRFAIEGNNLFGQRCYRRGCGIRPGEADLNTRFGLARFGSIRESVSSYVLNLNTHPRYRDFRELRKMQRDSDAPLKPLLLAEGLGDYSERGLQYVAELKALMRQNHVPRND